MSETNSKPNPTNITNSITTTNVSSNLQALASILDNPAIVGALFNLLENSVAESNEKRQKAERKKRQMLELQKQIARQTEKERLQILASQESCDHWKEGHQEPAIAGQSTHEHGQYAIVCTNCGKLFHTLEEIPPSLLSNLGEDELGGGPI